MGTRANSSGKLLEDKILDIFHDEYNIKIVKSADSTNTKISETVNCFKCKSNCNSTNFCFPQFKLNDIFGESKIDFKVVYSRKNFYFEVKNQNVKGSVDCKFPYYIENIKESVYKDGTFVFILNANGVRDSVLNYLVKHQQNLDFSVVDTTDLGSLINVFKNKLVYLKMTPKPVIKWAGGKRLVMDKIIPFFPKTVTGDYHELFAGGLSVFFHLYNNKICNSKNIFVNDNNETLINMYKVLKNDFQALLTELGKEEYRINEKNFYKNRKRFNELKSGLPENSIELSALFLFLNKSCFNGMYRENKNGEYNVPFCKKEAEMLNNSKIQDLKTLSEFLNTSNVCFTSKSFEACGDLIKKGDFVYMDPPYHNTFTGYSKTPFLEKEQILLKEFVDKLTERGVKVVVSNADTEFIKELYKDYTINIVEVKRVINSKVQERNKIYTELVITN